LVNVIDKIWRGRASRCRTGDAKAIRWRKDTAGYATPHYKPGPVRLIASQFSKICDWKKRIG
jgi:hypothetical protein